MRLQLFHILSARGVVSLLNVSWLLYSFPDKVRNPCLASQVLPNYASTTPFESHLYTGTFWISHKNCSLNLQYLWSVSWVFQQVPFCPALSHLSLCPIHQHRPLSDPAVGHWGPPLTLSSSVKSTGLESHRPGLAQPLATESKPLTALLRFFICNRQIVKPFEQSSCVDKIH